MQAKRARDPVEAWLDSGAAALTGPPDGAPLGPPSPLVGALDRMADRLAAVSGSLGRTVDVDPLVLLTERAAHAGLRRRGRTSCGGATRLLAAADDWVAVCLARPDDIDLLPAWLGVGPAAEPPWGAVNDALRLRAADDLIETAAELGLPVSRLGERSRHTRPAVCGNRLGDATATPALEDVLVVNLGALWAGPLCASLLAAAGATVVKVESTRRPDGARRGDRAFYDTVNHGARSVALDFRDPDARSKLVGLLEAADVVIEASRPRALRALGVDAVTSVSRGPRVWASITAQGRDVDRIGFGDDAAVAGGLVVSDGDEPYFCADAVADPVTGLVAAVAVLESLATGGRHLLDIAMSAVAARLSGPTLKLPDGATVADPARRLPVPPAPEIGGDTDAVLAELGLAP